MARHGKPLRCICAAILLGCCLTPAPTTPAPAPAAPLAVLTPPTPRPIAMTRAPTAPSAASAATTKAKRAFCWGDPRFGGSCPIADGLSWASVDQIYGSKYKAFVALDRTNNVAHCWGDREYGGSCSNTTGFSWASVDQLYSSRDAFVALDRTNNAVLCWGHLDYGGTCPNTTGFSWASVDQIYSADSAFVALDRTNNVVLCWGRLGYGGTCPNTTGFSWASVGQIYSTSSAFVALDRTNNAALCWGSPLVGGDCPSTAGFSWASVDQIYSNDYAFVALDRTNNVALCWGSPLVRGYGGECPSGSGFSWASVDQIYNTNRAFVALDRTNNAAVCWGNSRYGGECPSSAGFSWASVDQIYSNSGAFVALDRTNNAALCWGYHDYGGTCPSTAGFSWATVEIYSTGDAFVALDRTNNAALCWGSPFLGGECPSSGISWASVDQIYSNAYAFMTLETCGADEYQSPRGSCDRCPHGEVPTTNKLDCELCAAGRYASVSIISCEPCGAGKYSKAGSTNCSICEQGQVNNSDQSACEMCPAGRRAMANGFCEVCEVGRYARSGMAYCDVCQPGRIPSSDHSVCETCYRAAEIAAQGAHTCTLCQVDESPSAEHDFCQRCDAGKYAPAGSATCEACNENEKSNGRGGCTCVTDMIYDNDRVCRPCPEGAVCSDAMVQSAKPGHWLLANRQPYDKPVVCPFGIAACLGGNNCSDGRTGTGCSFCAEGFAPVGATCGPCASSGELAFIIAAAVAGLVALTFPCVKLLWTRRAEKQALSQADPAEERAADSADPAPQNPGNSEDPGEQIGNHSSGINLDELKQSYRILLDFVDAAKAQSKPLFLMMQVISGWTESLYLKYPSVLTVPGIESFHSFMHKLSDLTSVFALNIQVGSLKCAVGSIMEFILTIGLVFALCLLLAASAVVTACATRRQGKSVREAFEELFVPSYVLWSYLIYASLCVNTIQMLPIRGATFDCTFEQTIGCRLRVDYNIALDDAEYKGLGAPMAYAALGLVVIGIPLSFFAGMLRYRSTISLPRRADETEEEWYQRRAGEAAKEEEIMAFGVLFMNLKPRYWYFEVINLFRQFVLIGLLIMFDTSVKVHLFLSLVTLSLHITLIFLLRPYIEDSVNKSHFFSSLALIMMMVSQFVMIAQVDDSDRDPEAVALEGRILGISTCVVFSAVGLYMVKSVGSSMNSARSKALRKGEQRALIIAVQHARPYMETFFEKYGLEWDDVHPVIEAELLAAMSSGMQEILRNPQAFVSEHFKNLKPLLVKGLLAKTAPLAEDFLTEQGLEWGDVEPLLEKTLNGLGSPEAMLNNFQTIASDPSSCLKELAIASKSLILRMFVNKIWPYATAWLSQRGLEYSTLLEVVLHDLSSIDSQDDLQEKTTEILSDVNFYLDDLLARSLDMVLRTLQANRGLNSLLTERGMKWDDISAAVELDLRGDDLTPAMSKAKYQVALADPCVYVARLPVVANRPTISSVIYAETTI